MKKTVLFLSLMQLVTAVLAQETTEKKLKISFSGFLRTDFWYEDRPAAEAVEGLFSLFPLDENIDPLGIDKNDYSNTNLLAVSTRLSTLIEGPEWLGAQTLMHIEGDFTGTSNTNSIRFRHANIRLNWDKTQLLVGRFWHPMFALQAFPTVMALNTGAPFNPFNRSPQVRITHNITPGIEMLAAAVYQSDYTSPGPNGKSGTYLRNASMPELVFQSHFTFDQVSAGAGLEWKQIQPYNQTVGQDGNAYAEDELLASFAFQAYLKYTASNFEVKISTIQGQNLYEYLMLGGYVVSSEDEITGNKTYSPYVNSTYWVNCYYGNTFKIGVFGGVAKNHGTKDEIENTGGELFARGSNIDSMYRIAPWIAYKYEGFRLSAEWEYNNVAYGSIDLADKAKVKQTHDVASSRALLTFTYFF